MPSRGRSTRRLPIALLLLAPVVFWVAGAMFFRSNFEGKDAGSPRGEFPPSTGGGWFEDASLPDKVATLEGALKKLQAVHTAQTCLTIFTARNGLCHAPVEREALSPNSSAVASQRTSTAGSAVLRPPGYRREHRLWSTATPHWATQVTCSTENSDELD